MANQEHRTGCNLLIGAAAGLWVSRLLGMTRCSSAPIGATLLLAGYKLSWAATHAPEGFLEDAKRRLSRRVFGCFCRPSSAAIEGPARGCGDEVEA